VEYKVSHDLARPLASSADLLQSHFISKRSGHTMTAIYFLLHRSFRRDASCLFSSLSRRSSIAHLAWTTARLQTINRWGHILKIRVDSLLRMSDSLRARRSSYVRFHTRFGSEARRSSTCVDKGRSTMPFGEKCTQCAVCHGPVLLSWITVSRHCDATAR